MGTTKPGALPPVDPNSTNQAPRKDTTAAEPNATAAPKPKAKAKAKAAPKTSTRGK